MDTGGMTFTMESVKERKNWPRLDAKEINPNRKDYICCLEKGEAVSNVAIISVLIGSHKPPGLWG